MAEYKGIHGTKIQNYTSDPANPITGQVWYNETSQTMKFQYPTTINAWGTGGNLNTARAQIQGAGSQTATIAFGGFPEGANGALTESYNGSAWTEVNDLNTGRRSYAGAGTQTAAINAGGYNGTADVANTESWNGTSWTEVNDLNQARRTLASSKQSSTSALVFAGQGSYALTESWNGTSWTEVADLNTGRQQVSGAGATNTSALCFGGEPTTGATESWNGSAWTEVNDLNTARYNGGGTGTQTSAIAFAGSDPGGDYSLTESWNGTSWTEDSDMTTGGTALGSSGTSNSSALAFGGASPPATPIGRTEVWNTGIPIGAWSTGGSLNTARRELGGAGDSQDAALAFNGNPGSAPETNVITESYNGSAWTEVNDMNTARSGGAGTGTQTAAIAFGGNLQPGNFQGTETWNGTSWTTVPGTLSRNPAGTLQSSGTVTSALAFSGSGPNALTELYNGTTWTEVGDLNTARYAMGSGGTYTSAISIGGEPKTGATELWNGTSWSEDTDLNTARQTLGGTAASNGSALAFGGDISPPYTNATEEWTGAGSPLIQTFTDS